MRTPPWRTPHMQTEDAMRKFLIERHVPDVGKTDGAPTLVPTMMCVG
jgi:hypothetical protein